MNGAFYISATGLRSEQRALEVIANNIANINTPAFKRSQVQFSEMIAPQDAGGLEVMSGVSAEATARVFAQGDIRQTGRSTDVAIDGQGFIELMGPEGQTLLWRGGSLKVNSDGDLAASNGMVLKAMISVPIGAPEISIDRDGQVHAAGQGNEPSVNLGQIDLVMPKDVASLKSVGEGLYDASGASVMTMTAGEEGAGVLQQGAIEGANVQLSDEMVTLLMIQRAYAANAQVVQAGDQLMSIANELKR